MNTDFISLNYNNKKSSITEKAHLEDLYDKYSRKILGFIIKNNQTKIENEKVLLEVFCQAWGCIQLFTDNPNQNFILLLKIACKVVCFNKKQSILAILQNDQRILNNLKGQSNQTIINSITEV